MHEEIPAMVYTAVRTTGVYCIPTCSARPKRENVVYYDSALEAERDGFRPCKRCHANAHFVPWHDHKSSLEIDTPPDFSFGQCLVYLGRSNLECMHRVKGKSLYKLLRIESYDIVVEIEMPGDKLIVRFLNAIPPKWARAQIAKIVWDMFDLGVEIEGFYRLAEQDPILKGLCAKYRGLRIIKMHDLFEALCWAIIGQQVNLEFAYTLKRRLVEGYGEEVAFGDEPCFLFPTPDTLSRLQVEDLAALQFTRSKAAYIIEIGGRFASGKLRQAELAALKDYRELKERLLALRGVGNWTADYVILKCFGHHEAFPIQDVGLHNALRIVLAQDSKPTLAEIEGLAEPWEEWKGYAAFYLWRVLYD